MSAFDDLGRQLAKSLEERNTPSDTAEPPPRRSVRRRVRHKRGLLIALLALVFVAAATAATIVTQAGESPADAMFARVIAATGRTAACRMSGSRKSTLSDEAPDPRILATLPALGSSPTQPPGPAIVALAESNSGGSVLARTIRVLRLPGGISLIIYVAHGQGPFTLVEPRRCGEARLAELARLQPNRRDPVRARVAVMIDNAPETNPGVQSITIDRREVIAGRPLPGGGGSFPVLATDVKLPTGVLFEGSGCEYVGPRHTSRCSPDFYSGIAGPDAHYLTLQPAGRTPTGAHVVAVTRRVAVVEGFFAFTLPRDAVREVLVARANYGRALARLRVN
jgi:hypothetical protein